MKIQVGNLDFEEFEKRMLKWNKENNIEFAKFEEIDSITYISKLLKDRLHIVIV
jgi:hypothetical protein